MKARQVEIEHAGTDAATKTTLHWWRCPNGAFEFIQRGPETNGGFTRAKDPGPLFLDDLWKDGQEKAAWTFELARRAPGAVPLPTYPNTTMDERFFLKRLWGKSQIVWTHKTSDVLAPEKGYSEPAIWRLDLTCDALVPAFKYWIREQQQAAGITPRPGRGSKMSKGPSWVWVELLDRSASGQSLTESESRTHLKAQKVAEKALADLRHELETVRFQGFPPSLTERQRALRYPNLESLLRK